MNQHFHDFPRFREPAEPPRGPAIEGHRVTITVEEIPLGDLAVVISAKVTCKGVDDAYGDGGSAFDFAGIEVTGLDGRKTKITRPHPTDQSIAAHVWHAVVRDVEGSQEFCNEIMDRLEAQA